MHNELEKFLIGLYGMVLGVLVVVASLWIIYTGTLDNIGISRSEVNETEILQGAFYYLEDRLYEKRTKPEEVDGLVGNITKECEDKGEEWQEMCRISKIKRYVFLNITYDNTTQGIPTSGEVVEREYARCVGKAVLFSSMMRSLGYETQYVKQEGHKCVLYRTDEENKFFGCKPKEILSIY